MQGPSLSQIHPRGEFSTFPFSYREGQAWEGQVLLLPLTRANTLKEVKAQLLGFRKGMQQWPHCFSNAQNRDGREFSQIGYYTANSVCCLSNKLLKQMR